MENNSAIRTYMAIMAERDAALRERNVALDERRRAFAERDMAMLQRDAAIAERNNAIEERDKALTALQFLEGSMNENNISPDSLGTRIMHEADHLYHQQHMDSKSQLAETTYDACDLPTSKPLQTTAGSSKIAKPRKGKKIKEITGTSSKNSILSGKGKRGQEGFNEAVAASDYWKNEELGGNGDGDDLNLQLVNGKITWS